MSMQFFEAQRGGGTPRDASSVAPQVWAPSGWKRPANIRLCATALRSLGLDGSDAERALNAYPGHWEAGNIVHVTGTSGYTAAQQALGALLFGDVYTGAPRTVAKDPERCVPTTGRPVIADVRRHLEFLGRSLAAKVLRTGRRAADFVLITGVGDERLLHVLDASWARPRGEVNGDLCYIADAEHPAADIAAQAAAGMAMIGAYFRAINSERGLVALLTTRAEAAYAYAEAMLRDYGGAKSTCYASGARKNCVGDCGDTGAAMAPCELYRNDKPAEQQVFAAAAALFALTGDAKYRATADRLIAAAGSSAFTFFNSWNNVWAQGVTILASTERQDPAGATRSKGRYREDLKQAVAYWTDCYERGSNGGFCKRTRDGYLYPVDVPWGNMGTSLGGVCMAAIYAALPGGSGGDKGRARCFMQSQLAYITNHKCSSGDAASHKCRTRGAEGFSYIVGLGGSFPRRPHSRDAAYPIWSSANRDNPHTLCGAVISGPWAPAGSGGTDSYTDNRDNFRESEAGIDYSASLPCAMGGYAALTDSDVSGCGNARTPLTGR